MPQSCDPLPFGVDHIKARYHHGATTAGNLALACFSCNTFKASHAAGYDPDSGELTRLFSPRTDVWNDHSHGPELSSLNARYFAASVDTPDVNRQFADGMELDYPILSDPDRRVARAYGVVGASGFASRWTFYIGLDGRIHGIDKEVRAASHGAHVASRLRDLNLQGWSEL